MSKSLHAIAAVTDLAKELETTTEKLTKAESTNVGLEGQVKLLRDRLDTADHCVKKLRQELRDIGEEQGRRLHIPLESRLDFDLGHGLNIFRVRSMEACHAFAPEEVFLALRSPDAKEGFIKVVAERLAQDMAERFAKQLEDQTGLGVRKNYRPSDFF